MMPEDTSPPEMSDQTDDGIPLYANGRRLTETEIQALREAKSRRDAIDARAARPTEKGGAKRQTEATRYDDWEIAGRAIDFS